MSHVTLCRVAKLEASLLVAAAKVAASEAAVNDQFNETLASASEEELQKKETEAEQRKAAAAQILARAQELSDESSADPNAGKQV